MFARLVPFLILFATILFMMQTPVNRWLHLPAAGKESTKAWWIGAIVFQFFSAIYGGYFGAGNGILMLAAMGLLGLHDIHRANGIKNFLGVCINSVAVVAFSMMHLVSWPRSLFMAVAGLAGGFFFTPPPRGGGRGVVFLARLGVWFFGLFDALAADPRPAKVIKMEGEADLYRIRVGDYRIVYYVWDREEEVLVVKIAHRREVYR